MKKIDLKSLIITSVVCLLPILFGIAFYDKLPETMVIHFNINNEADGFVSKNFALFGIPIFMLLLQIFCCLINDINDNQKNKKPKFLIIIKWIIPILSIVISVITIEYSLDSTVDVRKNIILVLGMIYIIMGNYMPKVSYEDMKGKFHPMPKDEKLYRKLIRLMGYTFVVFGLLLLVSIIFKPIFSFIIILMMVLVLLIEDIFACIKQK